MKSKIQKDMTANPVSIAGDVSIGDAQELMRTWGMRHLPVVDGHKLVGVVSDRDIFRALSLRKPVTTEVQEIMTKSPYRVNQSVSLAEVAKVMAERKIGCCIVVDLAERVVGIFTNTDALNLLARMLNEPNEVDYRVIQLQEYLARQKRVV